MLPIIDTHQHLWDLTKFRLPWVGGVPSLNKSHVMSDYLEATKHVNIARTVYMEVDVAEDQQNAEVDYVVALCRAKDNPMAGAIISGRPESAGFEAYIKPVAEHPEVKALRRVLHGSPAGLCLQPQFVKSVQLLGKLGLAFDICIRPGELSDAVKLVQQCPGTQFMLDHCGNAKVPAFAASADAALKAEANQWRRDIEAVAALPNVYCKISGIVAGAQPGWKAADLAPPINHCLDTFGPDRVAFGGDWPVCTLAATYQQWVDALLEIIQPRREAEQRKLLHDNAARFYRV